MIHAGNLFDVSSVWHKLHQGISCAAISIGDVLEIIAVVFRQSIIKTFHGTSRFHAPSRATVIFNTSVFWITILTCHACGSLRNDLQHFLRVSANYDNNSCKMNIPSVKFWPKKCEGWTQTCQLRMGQLSENWKGTQFLFNENIYKDGWKMR